MTNAMAPLEDWAFPYDDSAGFIDEKVSRVMGDHALAVEQIAAIRASIRGISPVLAAACEAEALPITAVVFGLAPFANWPQQDYGWPWRPFTLSDALARLRFGYTRSAQGADLQRNEFIRRNLHGSVFVRAYERPEGAWAASVHDGVVGLEIRKGTSLVRTRGHRGTLRIATRLPESIAAAARGRRVAQLVDSPMFTDPSLVVTSVSVTVESSLVRFRCPPIAADIASLASRPSSVQLGRDPALTGDAALLDLLAREMSYANDFDASYLAHRLETRVQSLELTRPPGVGELLMPSAKWVASASRRLAKSGRVDKWVPF